jgi:hypothetical protein
MNRIIEMLKGQNNNDKMEVSRKEMIKEHKELVDILRGTDRTKQLSEAYKQEKELKELQNESN